MELSVHHYKRPSKKQCDRCGTNRTNLRFWIASPWNDRSNTSNPLSQTWKGTRYRRAYMSSMYVCKDCFIEIGKEIAEEWLKAMKDPKCVTLKVQDIQFMKDMAELRYERAKVNKVIKAQKFEIRQTKHKESNNGLDVVSAAL